MVYFAVCIVALIVAGLTLFSGFGLGTLLMPVFAVFFPVEIAVAATAVVHLANNLFKVGLVGRYTSWRVALVFGLFAAAAAVPGAWLLTAASRTHPLAAYRLLGQEHQVLAVKVMIGALMIVFALFELLPTFKSLEFGRRWLPLGGLLSGFFGGLSGHQGALRAAFLSKIGLRAQVFIGTAVICAVMVDVSRLTVYGVSFYGHHFHFLAQGGLAGPVAAATAAGFLGSFLGARLVKKVTMRGVQQLVGVMLFALALALGTGLV